MQFLYSLCFLLLRFIHAEGATLPDSCGNDKIKFEVKKQKGANRTGRA